ncbi:hypothetical protein IMZ48_09470 [Candidatus Bathyarchaeota archaeon]|nr:hypothetical protein [Candidatus Bathyarchaeota archaeon]
MSSVARMGSSSLRSSLRASTLNGRVTAFQGARCYSAKAQVCDPQSWQPLAFPVSSLTRC